MKILICGFGNIGGHVYEELIKLRDYDYSFFIYDKYNKNANSPAILDTTYDFAFVCVPTDNIDGQCDTSVVEESLKNVNADVIVLKSTVPIGFCDKQKMPNLVYSPEYWGTTVHSKDTPDFSILGGDTKYTHKVSALFSRIKAGDYRFIFVDYKTAELAKYMENCFIGLKVTFCNEFAAAAKHYGVEYEDLRQCWTADKRVSPSHTFVYEDQPYYDSHCLNKDIPAFINQCNKDGIFVPLMQTVEMINSYKKGKTKK